MKSYDLVDEVTVRSAPQEVWNALLGELRGEARWWVPSNTFKVISGDPSEPGGKVEWTVHSRGVDRGGPKLVFVSQTRSASPAKSLVLDYVGGVFAGVCFFSVEELEEGSSTKLRMHFRVRPRKWVALLARVAPIDIEHSRAARAAFANLADMLERESAKSGRRS